MGWNWEGGKESKSSLKFNTFGLSAGIIGKYLVFLFLFFNFIYFWLHWVFIAVRGLSLVAASGGYSSLRCTGFSLWWLLLSRSTGSRRTDFSSCGSRALERRLSSCGTRA